MRVVALRIKQDNESKNFLQNLAQHGSASPSRRFKDAV